MFKWLNKKVDDVTKQATKTASKEVKKEVKKTLVDFIPGILGFGAMILGIFVFHEIDGGDDSDDDDGSSSPVSTITKITTNNYFLGDVSDDIIKKILEDK